MKIYWRNYLWDDNANTQWAAGGSNIDVYWPAGNLLAYLQSAVARSTATHDLVVSFTAGHAPGGGVSVILTGIVSNIGATITLSYTTNGGGGPFAVTKTWNGEENFLITFTTFSGGDVIDGLTITIPKNTALTYGQLAKVFMGSPTDTGDQGTPDYGDYSHIFGERTNVDYAVLGQKYAEARAQYYAATHNIPYVTEALMATIRSWVNYVGTFTPFWLVLAPDNAALMPLNSIEYVTLQATPVENLLGYGNGYLWGLPFNVEEQL